MSSPALAPASIAGIGAYALAAVAIVFELVVLYLAFKPQVSPDYRAYYIDRTTTCPNQPVDGAYGLGTLVDFTTDGDRGTQGHIRVCGWEGPAGNGIHAVGESSRLRFAVEGGLTSSHVLRLMMSAVDQAPDGSMQVDVVANGTTIGTVTAEPGEPTTHDLPLPVEIVDASQEGPTVLEIELRYPQAILMGPNDSATRKRSIMLQAAGLLLPEPGPTALGD